MRGVALTVTLLLLMAPLGLAQDDGPDDGSSGSSSETGSASPSPEPRPAAECEKYPPDSPERRRCLEEAKMEYCRTHDDPRCPRPDGNQTGNGTGDEDRPKPPVDRCDEEHNESASQRCEAAVRKIHDERGRDWIAFDVDAPNATLLAYRIDGLLALDAVHLGLDDGNLSIERQGSTLRVQDGEAELRLHDEPNGLIRFKGGSGNVTLDFPAGARIARAEHGARVVYAGAREGHLLAENATWLDNDTVLLDGFFAFHVPPGEGAPPEPKETPELQEVEERKQEAIERRTLGAEITLKPRSPDAASLAPAANDSVEILAYDDLEVQVDVPAQAAAPDDPLRVVVSSELDEGRTIVLNVDEELLASTDPADLVLRYFDLHNQTDGSTLETEVVFHAAASLQDVLEPGDDGGQPEYWVVEDANGLQVLVSVPHWSAHAITVASIATALHAPSVTVGIVAGVAASLVMGALLVWPRRRDDEL